jgi:hypothetical protein
MSKPRKLINNTVNKIVERITESVTNSFEYSLAKFSELQPTIETLSDKVASLNEELVKQSALLDNVRDVVRAEYDDIAVLRNDLTKLRKTTEYKTVFSTKKPLISIRIATYNRAQTLIDKSIKSILAQTYQNFEVIIVGDHCTDDTEKKIKELNDPRIKFYNLYNRSIYPTDRKRKWQVIGALPMNVAASLCRGDWIAPLDDDDEFTPDHLEVLLKQALSTKSEMVYGVMIQKNLVEDTSTRIFSTDLAEGNISLNGAMYMKLLNSIYQYDQKSWVMDEPGDWNMTRRMLESGVNISGVDHEVGILNMIPVGHEKKDY